MKAEQHPSDIDLIEFVAGKNTGRERAAIAEHVNECADCRILVRIMEQVAGILLERLPPTAMANGSIADVLARTEASDAFQRPRPSNFTVSGTPSRIWRLFGTPGALARRLQPIQALPIAAAIALAVGVTYILIGSPASPPVSVSPGLKIVSLMEGYDHPIPVNAIQIEERPGYLAPNDDERPLAYERQPVFFYTDEQPGTLVINTTSNFLYLVLGNNRALRYAIGVGRNCFQWQGLSRVSQKVEWPEWTASPDAVLRQPQWPHSMPGGPGNPLGARAIDLHDMGYRIHGTNEPGTIGNVVSSGCFHLENSDIIDLYQRAPIGARVIIQQAPVI